MGLKITRGGGRGGLDPDLPSSGVQDKGHVALQEGGGKAKELLRAW